MNGSTSGRYEFTAIGGSTGHSLVRFPLPQDRPFDFPGSGQCLLERVTIVPGLPNARERGHSMEPKIKDGSWSVFRPCPAGSREGRIVLVQFNSMGDPENGGRFTVKKYHSANTVSEDAWQHDRIELLPLNRDYSPIIVTPHEAPEMVVVGEWVSSID